MLPAFGPKPITAGMAATTLEKLGFLSMGMTSKSGNGHLTG